MTDYKEIEKMNDADLASFVNEKREAVRAIRFGKAERNTSAASQAKRDIARALTELNKRSKAAAK